MIIIFDKYIFKIEKYAVVYRNRNNSEIYEGGRVRLLEWIERNDREEFRFQW